jgi:hypothetical protein
MSTKWLRLGFAIGLVLAFGSGCGRRTAQRPPTVTPTAEARVPLPEWAPKNPSPEFVRAAKVLKPVPPEVLAKVAASGAAAQALVARYQRTWVPAYELFGALGDQQIERFKSLREVRVPVKSMTRSQRRALDSYFEAWRKAMVGDSIPDWLVYLYKDGAKEDLSNVEAGFVSDGRGVNLQFWITRPDGSVSTPSNSVATM